MELRTPYRTKKSFIQAINNGQQIRVKLCPRRLVPILGPVVVRCEGWQALVTIKGDLITRVL